MPNEQITVHEAISRVVQDVGGVGRDGYNEHQRFSFRSIEGTVNAIRPSLLQHGLTIVPTYKSVAHTDYTRDDGKVVHRAVLEGTFQITGPNGDDTFVTTIGEATDMEGRATNKAMSAAFKYALLQTFQIGSGEDGDASDHAPQVRTAAPRPQASIQRPAPAASSPADRIAARAAGQQQPASAPRMDTGESVNDAQKKNLWRLFKKMEAEQGWTLNDYKDQIEIASGMRDDRQLTKQQASELISTMKNFAGEEDTPPVRASEPVAEYDDAPF
jgi:hypothetical protein